MQMHPRLARSRGDRMIAGVAAGVARYLNVDPTLVRLVFVLLAFSGPGFLIYPLLWLVMPEEPAATPGQPVAGQVFVATGETQRLDAMTGIPGEPEHEVPINNLGGAPASAPPSTGQGGKTLGYLLVGLGAFITLQMLIPGFAAYLFPIALIGAGVWLLRRG